MKKNLFFDIGNTLYYPVTNNWFITPNMMKIIPDVDKTKLECAIEKNRFLLDERNIYTENEEFIMFCNYYSSVLKDAECKNNCSAIVKSLAYDCVYNDFKVSFYKDVEKQLAILSKEYDLYVISDAWPSTHRILKKTNLYKLFKNVYISSELGCKKSDKTLFEIALENVDKNDENFFIDDRLELVQIAEKYSYIPILIDREKDDVTSYIKINDLKELTKLLRI